MLRTTDLNLQIHRILSHKFGEHIYITWKFERHFPGRSSDRSVSVLLVSRNRKFLGKWNFLRILFRAHFYTSTWFTLFSRNLAAKSLDNGPKDQVFQQLTGSAFSCTLTLLSLGMVISYILLLRSRSQFPPASISSSQLFHAFLVSSSCLYKIIAVFLDSRKLADVRLFPIARFLFYPSEQLRAFLFLSPPLPPSLSLFFFRLCIHAYSVSFTYSVGSIETYLLVRAADWFPWLAAACLSKGAQNQRGPSAALTDPANWNCINSFLRRLLARLFNKIAFQYARLTTIVKSMFQSRSRNPTRFLRIHINFKNYRTIL